LKQRAGMQCLTALCPPARCCKLEECFVPFACLQLPRHVSSQRRCDTLFIKDAWRGGGDSDTSATAAREVPAGWRMFCEQLWSAPGGEIKQQVGNVRLRMRHGNVLDHVSGAKVSVNSANRFLAGPARPTYWMFASYAGSSVDEAIHKAAPQLAELCSAIPAIDGVRCPVGCAVLTTPATLPPVVHAVAPGWHSASISRPLLVKAWQSIFGAAAGLDGSGAIVAPALGCGTNRTPLSDAAECCFEACASAPCLELRLVLNSYEAWMEWACALHFTGSLK